MIQKTEISWSRSRRAFPAGISSRPSSPGRPYRSAAIDRLNAEVYQSITSLNQKYIQDESPDGAYWEALKKEFLFEDGLIMMNNGTVGPMSGGLTAFSLDGVDCARIVDYVRDKYNLVVRTIGSKDAGTYAIRVSTPIYISTKEVDMLLEGVRTLSLHRS